MGTIIHLLTAWLRNPPLDWATLSCLQEVLNYLATRGQIKWLKIENVCKRYLMN